LEQVTIRLELDGTNKRRSGRLNICILLTGRLTGRCFV
jgi:hypothetical protein